MPLKNFGRRRWARTAMPWAIRQQYYFILNATLVIDGPASQATTREPPLHNVANCYYQQRHSLFDD